MKKKLIQAVPFLLSIVTLGLVYFVDWWRVSSNIGSFMDALYLYILFLLPITILLFFLPSRFLVPWIRFSVFWTVLTLFVVGAILSWYSNYVSPSRYNAMLYFFGPILVLGSLITIGISWLRSRKA